jgi:hypothetical protein
VPLHARQLVWLVVVVVVQLQLQQLHPPCTVSQPLTVSSPLSRVSFALPQQRLPHHLPSAISLCCSSWYQLTAM